MIQVLPKNKASIFSKTANATFVCLGLSGDCQVELLFVSKTKIKQLNRQFRGVDKATDVLSFPLLNKILPFTKDNYPIDFCDGSVLLGSVVICRKVAALNAINFGHSQNREICYLFVHGLLHLLGFDHVSDADKNLMRRYEEQVLSLLQISR